MQFSAGQGRVPPRLGNRRHGAAAALLWSAGVHGNRPPPPLLPLSGACGLSPLLSLFLPLCQGSCMLRLGGAQEGRRGSGSEGVPQPWEGRPPGAAAARCGEVRINHSCMRRRGRHRGGRGRERAGKMSEGSGGRGDARRGLCQGLAAAGRQPSQERILRTKSGGKDPTGRAMGRDEIQGVGCGERPRCGGWGRRAGGRGGNRRMDGDEMGAGGCCNGSKKSS